MKPEHKTGDASFAYLTQNHETKQAIIRFFWNQDPVEDFPEGIVQFNDDDSVDLIETICVFEARGLATCLYLLRGEWWEIDEDYDDEPDGTALRLFAERYHVSQPNGEPFKVYNPNQLTLFV